MPTPVEKRTSKATASTPDSRLSILTSATEEFARKGYAGARTEKIARAAGVKHTLVFYYFRNKERLYRAVLENVFSEWADRASRSLDQNEPPRQRLLAYVNAYFDYIAEFWWVPRLVQQEQLRHEARGVGQLRKLVDRYIQPIHQKLAGLIREGISTGVFRNVDVEHCLHSISALILFYFTRSLAVQSLQQGGPEVRAQVAKRRRAVLDFVSAALFTPGISQK
ncbi:MAG: TetR/AcrR family transcriptional regulator [Candidatus Sulfotelmatobacter sp.]